MRQMIGTSVNKENSVQQKILLFVALKWLTTSAQPYCFRVSVGYRVLCGGVNWYSHVRKGKYDVLNKRGKLRKSPWAKHLGNNKGDCTPPLKIFRSVCFLPVTAQQQYMSWRYPKVCPIILEAMVNLIRKKNSILLTLAVSKCDQEHGHYNQKAQMSV